MTSPVIRLAVSGDVPAITQLIELSTTALCKKDYSSSQIQSALQSAWGVDTELIRDGTYFVVEADAAVIACGGWGRRAKLFGRDSQTIAVSKLLDPTLDAARIRAFFVHPDWARKGIGRMLLEHCESAARAQGFHSAELVATLTGHRLYAACGYRGEQRQTYVLTDGSSIDFIPMKKSLLPSG
jgi:N-acetylglutamate synthase-like GNAT family acetyltransferase